MKLALRDNREEDGKPDYDFSLETIYWKVNYRIGRGFVIKKELNLNPGSVNQRASFSGNLFDAS